MKISVSETQYQVILEYFKKKTDPVAEHIRQMLRAIYKPLSKYGKLPNPDGNCDTNEGVIYVWEHIPGVDHWSVLNRFDTNTKVRDKIKELFTLQNPGTEITNNNLIDFITDNKDDLFNGKYTEELVNLNRATIDKGNQNELFGIKILTDFFGSGTNIMRFCSGDVRDTKKGMDLMVETNGQQIFVQVKPFTKATSFVDRDGDTFFEISSYGFDHTKYSEKNVQVFLYVNTETNEYVAFSNKKSRIKKEQSNMTRFYEPFLMTNIQFEGKTKTKQYRNKPLEDDLFKMGERRLQNLEFRKSEIDKLIELERQKLSKK